MSEVRAISLLAASAKRSAFMPMRAPTASPVAQPLIDDYARGLADGQQVADTAFAVERAALQKLVASAQALKSDSGPELSLLLRETVLRLVEQIAGGITIDGPFLERQIDQAVAIITEADNARQILLHPDDAALVGDNMHSLAVRSDPGLARGMIRIECSAGWIEHGVALGVERLRELLHVEGAAA